MCSGGQWEHTHKELSQKVTREPKLKPGESGSNDARQSDEQVRELEGTRSLGHSHQAQNGGGRCCDWSPSGEESGKGRWHGR